MDVVALQIWIGAQYLALSHSVGDHADDGRHRMRRPRMHGIPPIWRGSDVMCVNFMGASIGAATARPSFVMPPRPAGEPIGAGAHGVSAR